MKQEGTTISAQINYFIGDNGSTLFVIKPNSNIARDAQMGGVNHELYDYETSLVTHQGSRLKTRVCSHREHRPMQPSAET